MAIKQAELNLSFLVEELDLPESAYEKAQKRYEDLGEWFNRDNSLLNYNNVHIFPQGSFMLGTAIRPVEKDDEYDLDLVCKLREGISKNSHTQKEIKELIGAELEAYRKARGIQTRLDEKHRCWCLEYKDNISFHLDIVPAIPADELKKTQLYELINNTDIENEVAENASSSAISITDNRDSNYNEISSEWNISNPEGYGLWFAKEMRTNAERTLLEKARVDELPIHERKTPLQRCVQLLKRHRDIMFKENPDSKPISIIISTLAARAYTRELDIASALNNILKKMESMINSTTPRVPNPVNPQEDFTDKWEMSEYKHLRLEDNFKIWLKQAQKDFRIITESRDASELNKTFEKKFEINTDDKTLRESLGLANRETKKDKPKEHDIENPPKPWKL
ncbi:nucleotidyltransferase [Staphylococcus saprophyticus]|uniref:nucleotidyltransferase domain-containing protein n=1 Tax=Staphylococcus saprophyticus TaxID=29385 RepID=UPI00094BC20B|nr:nucleotidyltransferase [Staphylococcus saprophyticus]MDW4184722.1 nucleotidyltransferase [Staphylococcus saprophyticus]MDW4239228.1 nucleotidyltransferase [Staphylococcus saprophyticus]MDW4244099.1 nucleotidyltransferase [Staphylococcus saprophyticus]OLN92842.1 nucleotidyltransferase [Staphylococcus saprophyticus]